MLLDLALVSIPVLRGVSLKEPCRDTDREPSGVKSFGGAFIGACASSKSSVHETESLFSTTNFIIEEDCCVFLSNDNEWSMCSGPKDLDSRGEASWFARTVTTSFFWRNLHCNSSLRCKRRLFCFETWCIDSWSISLLWEICLSIASLHWSWAFKSSHLASSISTRCCNMSLSSISRRMPSSSDLKVAFSWLFNSKTDLKDSTSAAKAAPWSWTTDLLLVSASLRINSASCSARSLAISARCSFVASFKQLFSLNSHFCLSSCKLLSKDASCSACRLSTGKYQREIRSW